MLTSRFTARDPKATLRKDPVSASARRSTCPPEGLITLAIVVFGKGNCGTDHGAHNTCYHGHLVGDQPEFPS
jgi:hypothetical protein